MRFDRLLTHARLATMAANGRPYGGTDADAVGIRDGRIVWIGTSEDLPDSVEIHERDDLDGRWVTPALIDCHTHLVFAGDRSGEFERRLAGESYESIARSGGGIKSTVNAVRSATAAELAATALSRLDALNAEGLGTVEIKSGYGLNFESEINMLKAARSLGLVSGVRVRTTLLAAHAVPPEYAGKADAYIDEVCIPLIAEAARQGLADAVDAYCEGIGFSPEQVRRLFEAAKAAGLPVKLHADQLSDLDGAALAAEFGALSADHLEYTNEAGIAAMAKAGMTAVILPGAFYCLNETKKPPIAALREAGVPMALATDANPGTSPVLSLLTIANMGCTLFGMTVEEALAGITRDGARALGLGNEIGTIETGKRCDLAIWDVERPAELVQWIGAKPLHGRILNGEWA
ncbi:imidazolonepropionase [Hyphobacterium marinum]|uniref:Imidazolonepropionase n=1 Tax=Hyphobacterium marinum TaxID=3116574 RepID=A0ABU7LYX6_9PROT|nr:imidazolonepropionase [Hyphobacterium sp. Y6023]MEE2566733.1 imidazolonepropionase [Hyphobacterium sp. Y6023]